MKRRFRGHIKNIRLKVVKVDRRIPLSALGTILTMAIIWSILIGPQLLVEARHLGLSPKERLDAESGIRTSIIQMIGGLGLLIGLYFTARGFRITRDGHIADRYTKAIEQLGKESLDVRLGGIFALERLFTDSSSDRRTIVEVLTAFVREHTRSGPRAPSEERISADVQAALTVLGRRDGTADEKRRLDFYFTGLHDADLHGGDFRNAMFLYSFLSGARFTGARLDNADLSFCRAVGAAFTRASAPKAGFVNAKYTDGWFLNADLTGADFYGCDLSGSDFGRRYTEKGDPPLPPATVTGARFTEAILKGANFCGVDLSTAHGLTEEQISVAVIDENTVLPENWGMDTYDEQ